MKWTFVFLMFLITAVGYSQNFNVGDTLINKDTIVITGNGGGAYQYRLMRGDLLYNTKKTTDPLLRSWKKVDAQSIDMLFSLNCACDTLTNTINNLLSKTFIHEGRYYQVVRDSTGQMNIANIAQKWDMVSRGPYYGEYYSNLNFSGPFRQRWDTAINYKWGTEAPIPGFRKDSFAVRWVVTDTSFKNDYYVFSTVSNDGIRVYVDTTIIINDWTDHPAKKNEAIVRMKAGSHVIKIEYYDGLGDASVSFNYYRKPAASILPKRSISKSIKKK